MNDWYLGSLLVGAGVCLGFSLHAADLALQSGARRYVYLLALSVLQCAYCLVAYRYLTHEDGALALPWGQAICAFTPFIVCLFGDLTIDLTERNARWLRVLQRVNLALSTVFALAVVSDMTLGTALALRPGIETDLASIHRHRLVFTLPGQAWLGWVSCSFVLYAALLVSSRRLRRELSPMIVGAAAYFFATTSDFGILIGAYDAHFIQHFGYFALVLGCWRVLASRFEQSLVEQRAAIERLEAQRQRLLVSAPMLHKQKLDSLGTLAAGVAHEINNPIHGILNYAHLMKRGLDPESETRAFVDEIERESKRVAHIVRNLLHFGRENESRTIAADARVIVEDTLTLVRSLLEKDDIALEVRVAPDLPNLVCRVQQLEQVVMNLVMNARDALKRRSPERFEPKLISIHVRRRRAETDPEDDEWITIEVTDNGDGFDQALAERIFDPFFTTKPDGEGTGLGLSISHGIVRSHGGNLACESVAGKVTRFWVELPSSPPEPAPELEPLPEAGAKLGAHAEE